MWSTWCGPCSVFPGHLKVDPSVGHDLAWEQTGVRVSAPPQVPSVGSPSLVQVMSPAVSAVPPFSGPSNLPRPDQDHFSESQHQSQNQLGFSGYSRNHSFVDPTIRSGASQIFSQH